jgi:cob(I)alamin adenosyltransferase
VKLYTRSGDGGETSFFGGERVRKDDTRVEAYGTVDELNALLGLAISEIDQSDLCELLERVQRSLFDLGGELATPEVEAREASGKPIPRLSDSDVELLEQSIDRLDPELPPLRAFILPGGTRGAALLHQARAVCRRAERRVVRMAAEVPVAPVLLCYLNRLSDLLFVLARVVNRRHEITESTWEGRRK